ncbi:OLC1v1011821C1 [Oldenlandia corymbosa var. corymbosa]|uniref:Uridine kinase n=1 Tax=Oldenlandia corymbosa var. corymbosa TaxID=529605 RepID=A0AAV1DUJ0_OLDCO|nr:OLC1v1011821C1 [Oldenlandia corymbosa var. corymbosa]
MPPASSTTEENKEFAIDYVMEKASGPHFSGLRLGDGLLSAVSPSSSPRAPPIPTPSSATDSAKQPFVIGVSGGTASGKTTVCDMIIQQLHDHRVVLVNQDSFYRGLTPEELKRVSEYNFDHPDAFDTEQLLECVDKLKSGHSVQVPIYDFKTHQRCSDSFRQVNASDVIILEGILVFHDQRVRNLMNMKVFVDTDADVRLARRIRRDTVERGRDINSVLEQYAKFVKPAFDDFVLPSKKYADVIIPRGGENHVAVDLIVQHIRTKLGQHDLCKIYPNVYVIQSTFQIRGMHTLIRDRDISKHDFVFYSDRLIRLVVEHGLGHLPFTEMQVVTPTGSVYTGVDFCKKLCGVSIVRSGESMENALRACCKGIKIGKILIHRDGDNGKQLIYEKLPKDISERHVLLLDPVLATGNSANQAIDLLIQKGVPESYIIFLNLISAPEGIHCVSKRFPSVKIVTSEIDVALNEEYRVIPGITDLNVEPYDEDQGTGELRYVQMAVTTYDTSLPVSQRYDNGKVQVTLVWNSRNENSPSSEKLNALANFLWRNGGPRRKSNLIHSVWANFQTSSSNIIFGNRWRHLFGERDFWEHVGGIDVSLAPSGFGQANTKAFDSLLHKLQKYVPYGAAVVDLYAGAGVIGLSLAAARRCRSVKCVEVNKESKHSFEKTVERLPSNLECNISWHHADASVEPISWLVGSEVVVVDPPRKGLEPSLADALQALSSVKPNSKLSGSPFLNDKDEKRPWILRARESSVQYGTRSVAPEEDQQLLPETLIYVSCGWQSFKEDCRFLLANKTWHLHKAHGFNFFPGTQSIEILAVFKRGPGTSTKKKKPGKKKRRPSRGEFTEK